MFLSLEAPALATCPPRWQSHATLPSGAQPPSPRVGRPFPGHSRVCREELSGSLVYSSACTLQPVWGPRAPGGLEWRMGR